MPLEKQTPYYLRKEVLEKEKRYTFLLGINYWEVLNLGISKENGKSEYPGVEERKEKARKVFQKHNPYLEARLKEYVIQSEKGISGLMGTTRQERCLICDEKYSGVHCLCGVCGYVYREEFAKKK
jgi:hypothetical protein